MAFSVKDWKDYPDTSTPITAAALEDLESRVSTYADTVSDGFGLNVRSYGAKGDGTTDDTQAIRDAVAAATADSNRVVFFPRGQYKVTGQITITSGVKLICEGTQGSTQQFGTTFVHYSNGNLFVWDGSGVAYGGTGGGLHHCLILKPTGYSGGDAIKLYATSNDYRPGEMEFTDVLVLGSGGQWARGLHIDGTNCTTAGSKGVRTVVLHKFRVGSCTTNNEYIKINQGTHITGVHVAIDTVGGSGTAGMTVTGDSDSIHFSNLVFYANFVATPSASCALTAGGHVADFSVNANTTGLYSGYISGSVTNSSNSFTILSQDRLSLTNSPISSFRHSGSVSYVGQIGLTYPTTCANTKTFTFSPGSAKLFTLALGGGQAALIFADYVNANVGVLSDPSSIIDANTASPAAGKIGVYKSAGNNHDIYVKNNTGSSADISILALGAVSATTDPA